MKRIYQMAWVFLLCLIVLVGVSVHLTHRYEAAVQQAHEAVLNEDRKVVREAIKWYTEDKGKRPQTLEDLVDAGYLKAIPQVPDLPLPHRKSN